jgi:class 3 adenylate cyclase/pimeloyl-ACP methyl ester carboxylesterase
VRVEVPETRYARSGRVSIAYQVLGDGPRDIVFVPGLISNIESAWQQPAVANWLRSLGGFSRLIWFDKRGTGVSDRVSDVPTLETRMDDVRAVMDEVGSEQAVLLGVSEGGPMSILFAATYPERVSALILWGSDVKGVRTDDYPWAPSFEEAIRAVEDAGARWGTSDYCDEVLRAAVPSVAGDEDFRRWWASYMRLGASPASAASLRRMNMEIDVRHVLPAIRVPTLVLHRTDDRLVDVRNSRYIAERIPGARGVELAGLDHFAWIGDTERVLAEIKAFLADVTEGAAVDRRLATVLFTDIVGSTQKAAELGDSRWKSLLTDHHERVRAELTRFRGEELDTAGDGFFASFDGPARAIRCASAIAASVRELGIEVRAGLHTGECEVVDGKIGGIAVHIGARVAGKAAPGEVLVSSTVKDLVAGSGIAFRDRGAVELEGIAGEWRLYAVESDPNRSTIRRDAETERLHA